MQDVVQMKKSSPYAGFFVLILTPINKHILSLIPTSYARCNFQNQSLSE